MDYGKKLALAKEALDSGSYDKETIEYIFPELKESEDEKIREALLEMVHDTTGDSLWIDYNVHKEDAIAWLEKQGDKSDIGISSTTKQKLKDNLNKALEKETPASWNEFLDEGEQEPTDNVEPKFNVEDWIVDEDNNCVYQIKRAIENVTSGGFSYDLVGGGYFPSTKKNYHIWTIQDAKDGDVLAFDDKTIVIFKDLYNATTFHSYCHIEDAIFGGSQNGMPDWWDGKGFKPATKEQRDLLFQKMKEAGYQWDVEKKELEKIEQKQVIDYQDNLPKDNWELVHEFIEKFGRIPKDEDELNVLVEYVLKRQKPTEWSEEDEVKINRIVACLKNLNVADNDILLKDVDWLKSLRHQNTWKPSDEQMEILQYLCETSSHPNEKVIPTLESLYQDLKKLK